MIIMVERREFEQRYARFWRKLASFLKNNTWFHASGVAREGSRRWGTHDDRSDLDVIFFISGDPTKGEIYPRLVDLLGSGMNLQTRIGTSYNAIKIEKGPLRCDLLLRTEVQFQTQIDNRLFEEI
jgi:hypothetical protein